jgi:hypothetical protein
MAFFRRLLSLTLCLSLGWPAQSFAVLQSRTPEAMLALVDEYVQEIQTQPGAYSPPIFGRSSISRSRRNTPFEIARATYLAQRVVGQVITLNAEDFNMFMFYAVERYVKEPKQRPQIYLLFKQLHDAIAADLQNSKQLRDSPYHEMVSGAYSWMTWILVLYVGFRFKATQTLRGREFLAEVEKRELAIGRNKYYRSAYNVVSNPLVWSSAVGAGLGYLNYLIQSSRVHKLDPLEILKVVQAQLACDLSYRGLEIEQEWLNIKNEPLAIAQSGPQLQEKITEITSQAATLHKQYGRLESLDVKERLFQQTLKLYPQAESWQQFRKNLSEADDSKDGQCRQMSLVHLKLELEKIADGIKDEMPEKKAE